jgi:hypothetical protein
MPKGAWAAALLAASLAGRTVRAQEGFDLSWQAPSACPQDLSFLRRVEAFLGRRLPQGSARALLVDARVTGDDAQGYVAALSFKDARGSTQRELTHPDCTKLTEAAALLVALVIDPERVKTIQEQGSAPSPPAPSEPATPAEEPAPPAKAALPAPVPAEPVRRPESLPSRGSSSSGGPRFSAGVSGLVATGLLPSAAAGVGAELVLSLSGFEAGLGGRYWFPRSAAVPLTAAANVDVSVATATLRVCGVPRSGQWSFAACARADLGDMMGRGEGVDNARARHDSYGALGAAVSAGYSIGRVSPVVGTELLVLVGRPRFGVLRDGQDQSVFQPNLWQLSGFIGLRYVL